MSRRISRKGQRFKAIHIHADFKPQGNGGESLPMIAAPESAACQCPAGSRMCPTEIASIL